MPNKIVIKGKNYYLQTLVVDEVNQKYVDWLNDEEVNKFLEVRHKKSTISNIKSFVQKFDNEHSYLFGIFDSLKDQHIGNMALYLDLNHITANFGF